jgi:hypothetical protein
VDRARIDQAVADRDVDFLASLICTEGLDVEVKEHLAAVVFDLLTGKTNFPRRRPKKKMLEWDNEQIGQEVWVVKKRERLQKISSAVERVANERHISPRTVWKCWKSFDFLSYEFRREKAEFDYLMDMANETRREAAVNSLKEAHGDRAFTDEEIEAEAQELDTALQDWGDEY